jgi:hypothetical protein
VNLLYDFTPSANNRKCLCARKKAASPGRRGQTDFFTDFEPLSGDGDLRRQIDLLNGVRV